MPVLVDSNVLLDVLTEDSRWVIRALAEESYKRNPTDLATLRMAGLSDSAVAALVGRLHAL